MGRGLFNYRYPVVLFVTSPRFANAVTTVLRQALELTDPVRVGLTTGVVP